MLILADFRLFDIQISIILDWIITLDGKSFHRANYDFDNKQQLTHLLLLWQRLESNQVQLNNSIHLQEHLEKHDLK